MFNLLIVIALLALFYSFIYKKNMLNNKLKQMEENIKINEEKQNIVASVLSAAPLNSIKNELTTQVKEHFTLENDMSQTHKIKQRIIQQIKQTNQQKNQLQPIDIEGSFSKTSLPANFIGV